MHPGDQHLPQNDKSGQSNPFAPQTTSITRMSAQEIATLQAKLDRQLGPEYISDRPGAGGVRVQYLEAWKCINLANEIFGFNGWSSSIQNIAVDYMDENKDTGRVSLGLSVVVRVTLKDGVYHEDIGYGSIDNARSKAAAFEKCKKEGTTDALKRALRNFGNVLGNCLYDKSYIREVSKIKTPAPRFDPHELHRRPEFAPAVKTVMPPHPPPEESIANTTLVDLPVVDENLFQDQFDDNYFDDYDFEDRPILAESPRLNEFETNALHTRTRTAVTPVISKADTAFNGHQHNNTEMMQRIPAQNDTIPSVPRKSPPAAPVPVPNEKASSLSTNIPQQLVYRNTVEQQSVEQPQLPGQALASVVGFSRVGADGTPLRPYNPQAGFSPYATGKSNGIDYSKSTPIPRALVQKGPLNNSDAHNRMAQVPPMLNQNSRLVGCPPNRQYSPPLHSNSPYRPGVHARANSGPSVGVKRNIHGQSTSAVETAGRIVNQGQVVAQPDPKRARN